MEAKPATTAAQQHGGDVGRIDLLSMRKTQIGCVLNVLKNAKERFKISLMLPKLLDAPELLKEVLTGTQYEPAISLVNSFVKRRDDVLRQQIPPLSDHRLIKIIDYFQFNSEIYNLFPSIHDIIATEKNELFKIFEDLCNICELHLFCGAKKNIYKEQRMNKLYHENEKVKQNIVEILAKISKEKSRQNWKLTTKATILNQCKEDLHFQRDENERKIFIESYNSQHIIRTKRKNALEQQHVLEEELKTLKVDFEKQEKFYTKEINKNREEKNKVELQLEAIIKKYDSTIKDRMIQIIDIDSELLTANRELNKLMKIHDKEFEIYEKLVLRIEQQKERNRELKILRFMMNFAARQIQRYWRNWRRIRQRKLRILKTSSRKGKPIK